MALALDRRAFIDILAEGQADRVDALKNHKIMPVILACGGGNEGAAAQGVSRNKRIADNSEIVAFRSGGTTSRYAHASSVVTDGRTLLTSGGPYTVEQRIKIH